MWPFGCNLLKETWMPLRYYFRGVIAHNMPITMNTFLFKALLLYCVQLSLLQQKLQAELPDDALVVAGRFPFPDWTPCRIEGHGVDRAWAYNIQAQRLHTFKKNDNFTVSDSKNGQSIWNNWVFLVMEK